MSELLPGETREPEAGLETAMLEGRSEHGVPKKLLQTFSVSPVIVPSAEDFTGAPEKFRPIMFRSPSGKELMAVFTAMDRALRFAEAAPYTTTMLGRKVLAGLQADVGLVVNPGWGLGFEIDPSAVQEIIGDLIDIQQPSLPDPNVALERAILDALAGTLSRPQLLKAFAGHSLYVPSRTEVTATMDQLDPLVFDRDGTKLIGVFTRPEFFGDYTAEAKYVLHVKAIALAKSMAAGKGIVVNPGRDSAYVFGPEELAEL